MTLDELKASYAEEEDDDLYEEEDETDVSLEENLTSAVEHLNKLLLVMEAIIIQKGRVIRVPGGMLDIMNDAAEFLDGIEALDVEVEVDESKDDTKTCEFPREI